MVEPSIIEQANALFEQGNSAFLTNDFNQALDYYQQAAALRPDSGLIWQNIAACLQALNQPNAAIDALDMAVKRNPKAYDARLNLAQAYLETYQLGKAQLHFFALLQEPDYRADAHAGLGVILMRQGKWYAAILELTEASQRRPSDVDTLINLATCHVKQQNISEAISLLTRAHTLAPDHAIANYRLAALTGTDTPERAPADYVKALFDHYADYFDKALLNHLQYQGPEALMALLRDAKLGPSQEISSQTPRFDCIYDLGCGTGLMGRSLAPLCHTLVGIDLSPRMLLEAEKQGCYQALHLGDIMTILKTLPPADLLVAADTFCYLGELTALFQVLAAATKVGGYVLFSTEWLDTYGHPKATDSAPGNIKSSINDIEKNPSTNPPYHLQKNGRYQHSSAYIEKIASQAGFTRISHTTAQLRLEQGEPVRGDYWLYIHHV